MSTSDKEMVRIRNAAWTLHTVPMWWRTSCFTSLEKRNSERLYWTNERSVIYSIQQIRLPTSKSSTTDQSWDNLKVEYSICSQSHYPSTLWNRITSRDLRLPKNDDGILWHRFGHDGRSRTWKELASRLSNRAKPSSRGRSALELETHRLDSDLEDSYDSYTTVLRHQRARKFLSMFLRHRLQSQSLLSLLHINFQNGNEKLCHP